VIPQPHVDWFALAPELMLLGAMGFALLGAVLLPRANRRDFGALAAAIGFAGAFVYAIVIYIHTPEVHSVIADSVRRDRFGALAQVIIAGAGLLTVGVSYARRMRDEHIAEYYALLAAAGAGAEEITLPPDHAYGALKPGPASRSRSTTASPATPPTTSACSRAATRSSGMAW